MAASSHESRKRSGLTIATALRLGERDKLQALFIDDVVSGGMEQLTEAVEHSVPPILIRLALNNRKPQALLFLLRRQANLREEETRFSALKEFFESSFDIITRNELTEYKTLVSDFVAYIKENQHTFTPGEIAFYVVAFWQFPLTLDKSRFNDILIASELNHLLKLVPADDDNGVLKNELRSLTYLAGETESSAKSDGIPSEEHQLIFNMGKQFIQFTTLKTNRGEFNQCLQQIEDNLKAYIAEDKKELLEQLLEIKLPQTILNIAGNAWPAPSEPEEYFDLVDGRCLDVVLNQIISSSPHPELTATRFSFLGYVHHKIAAKIIREGGYFKEAGTNISLIHGSYTHGLQIALWHLAFMNGALDLPEPFKEKTKLSELTKRLVAKSYADPYCGRNIWDYVVDAGIKYSAYGTQSFSDPFTFHAWLMTQFDEFPVLSRYLYAIYVNQLQTIIRQSNADSILSSDEVEANAAASSSSSSATPGEPKSVRVTVDMAVAALVTARMTFVDATLEKLGINNSASLEPFVRRSNSPGVVLEKKVRSPSSNRNSMYSDPKLRKKIPPRETSSAGDLTSSNPPITLSTSFDSEMGIALFRI